MPQRYAPIFTAVLLSWAGCAPQAAWSPVEVCPTDDAARCQALAGRMGLSLRTYQSQHFLLLWAGQADAAAQTGGLLDQASRRFHDGFIAAGFPVKPPPDKLVWVCLGSYDALETYGRQADGVEVSWMDAFYSLRTNRVAVVQGGGSWATAKAPSARAGAGVAFGSPGAGLTADGQLNLRTVTHELAHQLAFNSGLQRRGLTYAFWLTEGLATNFEADALDDVGPGRDDPDYRARLAEAKAAGELIGLEELVSLTAPPAGAAPTRRAYAQAWGLFHYLFQCRREQLRKYLSVSAQAPAGEPGSQEFRQRFVACFGEIAPLQDEFLRFIDGGDSPATDSSADTSSGDLPPG